jgi:hypothetical protein
MVTVNVDGSVLDRIAKIMTYLRLGSSGKVLKKKKKEKDIKGIILGRLFGNYGCYLLDACYIDSYSFHKKHVTVRCIIVILCKISQWFFLHYHSLW